MAKTSTLRPGGEWEMALNRLSIYLVRCRSWVKGGSVDCFDPNRSRAPTGYRIAASVRCTSKNALGTVKGAQVAGQPELVHAAAVRANMRSILVAMMKSFSCSPLIFLVCRETVALPQPKLIFG